MSWQNRVPLFGHNFGNAITVANANSTGPQDFRQINIVRIKQGASLKEACLTWPPSKRSLEKNPVSVDINRHHGKLQIPDSVFAD